MTTWTTTDLASSTTSTRNFTYGDAAHPDAPTSNGTMTLTYDANGSAATRAGTGLSWDALHRLIGITGTQTNVYGNDGLRLMRTDTTAATVTLFLPGQQVTGPVGAGAVTTAIRSYQLGATTIATRTGPGATGVYWNCGQRQNSTSCSTPINTGSAPATPIARYMPYGTPRTGSPTLPGTERGFVGQITDTTGLNQLGQRVYDPTLGHFLSVDPLVSATGDPYLYTAGNPTTLTDPNGLEPGCSPNALAGACSAEHADQERIRPSYLEGSTPKQSDQVRQVQDYANVCINQWQWCVDSLADGDSHPIYGADGGLLDSQDLGLMSHAVALLMMLIGQGLAYVDGSGSGAVLRAGNLPNGNNTMGIEVYGTSVSDMAMVASTWHIGWRERFTPGLQMLALIADGVAVIGGATCAFTAGVGCGVAAGATAVSAAANAGVVTLNCTTGHQQTCGFAIAGIILSGAQLGAGSIAGKALNAGRLPVEIYQSLNAYSAITTSFFDVLSLNVPTGDGGEMGSVNIFRVTGGT